MSFALWGRRHRSTFQTRSWDDKESGAKKYRTEILVNELSLLGKPGGASEGGSGYSRGGTASYPDTGTTDDDIPF